jgi:hypothetical protein
MNYVGRFSVLRDSPRFLRTSASVRCVSRQGWNAVNRFAHMVKMRTRPGDVVTAAHAPKSASARDAFITAR